MSRRRPPFMLFAVALVLASGLAAAAFAATAAPPANPKVTAAPSAPTTGTPYSTGDVEVQIWPMADSNIPTQAVVITDVALPSDTQLPAVVRIPIVPGTKVMWAGESLGGSPDADPARQMKEVDGVGGKYAEFVLSKSLRGQIDSIGVPLASAGDTVSFSVNWVQSTEASSVVMTVRFNGGSSRVKIDPKPQGEPVTNLAGESLYVLPKMKLAPGAKQLVKVSYSTNPSGEAPIGDTTRTAIYVGLGTLLVLAIALLAFLFVRRGRASADDSDAEDSDEYGDETDDADSEPGE